MFLYFVSYLQGLFFFAAYTHDISTLFRHDFPASLSLPWNPHHRRSPSPGAPPRAQSAKLDKNKPTAWRKASEPGRLSRAV